MNTSKFTLSNDTLSNDTLPNETLKPYQSVNFCYKHDIDSVRKKEGDIELHKKNASICFSFCVKMFNETANKYCLNGH